VWSEVLATGDIRIHDNFFELGGHSLLAARMLGRVEAEFGRRISLAGLFRAPTIRELAQLLDRNDLRDFDFRQVVKLQPLGSRPPVIGINNTGIYYMLAKRLGAEQPFTSLQLFDPSVKTAEMPKTLEEIAAGYVQLIRRVQPTGPYVLMGWCVAGALAFEVACQLDAKFGELAQLYLMDSWVPNYRQRLPALRSVIADYSLRWQFILADWRAVKASGKGLLEFLRHRLVVKKFLLMFGLQSPTRAVVAESREVTPEDYDQWLLGYLQALTSRYEPKVFRGRILLFRSRAEPTGWWFDPQAGWGPFAAGGVDLQMVVGDHFTMFSDPGVSQMAERIAELSAQPHA
jgi:thioesterase domain-containing protein/acyl carrier protein